MEQSFVAWAKMRARRLRAVKLGIGDDAAVLENRAADSVLTTDTLLEGTHFDWSSCEAVQVGRKAVLVNLSDLAAMAAEPDAILVTLCLPRRPSREQTGEGLGAGGDATNAPLDTRPQRPEKTSDALAAELFEGVCEVCDQYGLALAGGDTNCWDGPVVISVTAIGYPVDGRIWTRSGARPEDLVIVTGGLGGSILGKHLEFCPRLDVARCLRDIPEVHAAMDISDGLSIDLLRMSDASRCGAILDPDAIPIAEAAVRLAERSGKTPLEHALGDGEDFELLLAVAEQGLPEVEQRLGRGNFFVCGRFTSRTGLWVRRGGRIEQLPAIGYLHGAAADGPA